MDLTEGLFLSSLFENSGGGDSGGGGDFWDQVVVEYGAFNEYPETDLTANPYHGTVGYQFSITTDDEIPHEGVFIKPFIIRVNDQEYEYPVLTEEDPPYSNIFTLDGYNLQYTSGLVRRIQTTVSGETTLTINFGITVATQGNDPVTTKFSVEEITTYVLSELGYQLYSMVTGG